MAGLKGRALALARKTKETDIILRLDPDAGSSGRIAIDTGIGFLDHLLGSLATHAGWSLQLRCTGDLVVDDHHSAEDCAILLGQALARILSQSAAVQRFGSAYAPMDEALARAVVDLSGRPYVVVDLGLERSMVGELAAENIVHVLQSLGTSAGMNLHVDVLRGGNDHHRAEAAFKALALALGMALRLKPASETGASSAEVAGIPSTKGRVNLTELDESDFAARFAAPGRPE